MKEEERGKEERSRRDDLTIEIGRLWLGKGRKEREERRKRKKRV